MDNNPIGKKRAEQEAKRQEEQKHSQLVEAVKASGNTTKEGVTTAIHDLLLATLVGKDPRLVEVAKNLGDLLEGINKAAGDLKNSPLKNLPDIHAKLISALKSLPDEVAKTDRSPELIPYLQEIASSVKSQKLNPSVKVAAPDVDLSPLTDYLKKLEKAVKDIPKTEIDLEPLRKDIRATTKAINGLSFPVPNYILPFKDSDGKAVQVLVDADGNIPTSSTDPDNTASGIISTQNLVPAGVATANSAVEITLGSGQNTIAIQTVGTYTGALTLQGTVDGNTWVSFAGTPLLNANTGLWLATITSALQSVFFAKVSGFAKVRISANAAVTGSVTVSIGASTGDSFQGALGVLTTVTTVTTLTTLTNITNWGNVVDNAAFVDGTTRLLPPGYIYDEVAGTALTENDAAAARIDSKRAQILVGEDATTRGQRWSISAAGELKVDGSAVTQPISAASMPLPTGASTSAIQTDGTQKTQIVDAGGEQVTVTGGKLDVNATLSGAAGGTSAVDDAAFTVATDTGTPAMALADEVSPDSVNEGDVGVVRMSLNRNLYSSIRDAAGNERGVNVTAGNALVVDGSASTQPISGTVTANAGTNLNTSALALAATQTDKSQFTKLTDGTDTALITAAGEQNVIATAQPGVDIGDVTINNPTIAVTQSGTWDEVGINDSGNSITVDQPTGTNLHVVVDSGTITTVSAVTAISNALPAGNNNIGDVDIASALPAGTNAIGKLAANSGVDIGDVDVTSAVSATLDHGSNRDIDTVAEQITATSFACKFGVTLRADDANTGVLYIGNSDVTAGSTAATDGIPLAAGESLFLPVNNSNIPYAIASANNQIIYWVAV